MPGGCTHARMSRSLSQAAVRLPRFALTAWWIGPSTWSSTNTVPMNASGAPSGPAVLDRADDHPHRDGEGGREHAAHEER